MGVAPGRIGLRAGFELIDLGAYLTPEALERVDEDSTELVWNDILQPSVSAGVVLFRGLVLGAQVTLQPYADADKGQPERVQFGASASWYVPFFDFN